MGIFKNEVGRPSNETIKKRNIFKGICILLVIVVIGLVVYILNDKGVFGNNVNEKDSGNNQNITTTNKRESEITTTTNKRESEITTTTKKNIIDKKISIEEAEKIMLKMFGDTYMRYLYMNGINIYNDQNFKTMIALKDTTEFKEKYDCKKLFGGSATKIEEETWNIKFDSPRSDDQIGGFCNDDGSFYKYDDVNKTYQIKFGNNKNAVKEDINSIFTDLYGFSKKYDGYKILSCNCGDVCPEISGITSAYIKNNRLIIEIVSAKRGYLDGNYTISLKDGTVVNLTEEEAFGETTYKKYKNKMNTYKFQFFIEDELYKFEKAEKIA